jgi:hypothetical protein
LRPWLAGAALPLLACGAAIGGGLPLAPGESYFTDEFDPALVPWQPAPERNVEEVFKNHQYYEIVIGKDRATLIVVRHRRDLAPDRQFYRLLPSGGLAPLPAAAQALEGRQ